MIQCKASSSIEKNASMLWAVMGFGLFLRVFIFWLD